MVRNTDDLKGRVEEAAGDLTRGKRLKIEGKPDRAAGSAKDAVDGRGPARAMLGPRAITVIDTKDQDRDLPLKRRTTGMAER